MRVQYDVMVQEFARVLEKKGFQREDAESAAVIFAQNSLAGVFSHGLNRFPRVVSYLEKGEIDPDARATCEMSMGAIERWDGHRGFGPLNAKRAMDRACGIWNRMCCSWKQQPLDERRHLWMAGSGERMRRNLLV